MRTSTVSQINQNYVPFVRRNPVGSGRRWDLPPVGDMPPARPVRFRGKEYQVNYIREHYSEPDILVLRAGTDRIYVEKTPKGRSPWRRLFVRK
jgi:hypothetical protein